MSDCYIGVMTGNSMDAADAVLVQFEQQSCKVAASARQVIDGGLAADLRELAEQPTVRTDALLQAQQALTDVCAAAVAMLNATAADVVALGCHGQTLAHRPATGSTWQLLNGALLAEKTGLDVVCDFRARDMASGGEGAPLAPLFHRYLFAAHAPVDVINIGGIANISHVERAGTETTVSGYDIGPGMMLSDAWFQHCRGDAGIRYDDDGAVAAAGNVNEAFLRQLLQHPFFSRRPPKSCGREEFYLTPLLEDCRRLPSDDVQATLLELTARSIAEAVRNDTVVLCGGGARNGALRRRLEALLPSPPRLSDEFGIAAEQMEAALLHGWRATIYGKYRCRRRRLPADGNELPARTIRVDTQAGAAGV